VSGDFTLAYMNPYGKEVELFMVQANGGIVKLLKDDYQLVTYLKPLMPWTAPMWSTERCKLEAALAAPADTE